MANPSPTGEHDNVPRAIEEPRWRDDHEAWRQSIDEWSRMGGGLTPDQPTIEYRAVAIAIFHTAAQYNTGFINPHPTVIATWAYLYQTYHGWLTIDLAERSVHAHFAQSNDGRMVPADVILQAKRITGMEK